MGVAETGSGTAAGGPGAPGGEPEQDAGAGGRTGVEVGATAEQPELYPNSWGLAIPMPKKPYVDPVDPRERRYTNFSDEDLEDELRLYQWWWRELEAGAVEVDAQHGVYLQYHIDAITEEQARRHRFQLSNPKRWKSGLTRAFLDNLKQRFDLLGQIEHDWIRLRRGGKTYYGPCPFHGSNTGDSFHVYPDPADAHFHCFNCGIHGDAFTWMAAFHQPASFVDAVALVARAVGVAIPRGERMEPPRAGEGRETDGGQAAASLSTAAPRIEIAADPDSNNSPPFSGEAPSGPGERSARPTRFTAVELLELHLPEPRWAVPGLLPEGLTLLAGRPKLGKSWLALSLALAVAAGGRALGSLPVEAGPALYLALEDGTKRLQARLAALLHGARPPEALTLWTACPRVDQGGLNALIEWIYFQRDPRLIVIDTLKRIRARTTGGRPLYDEDYDAIAPLATLAQAVGIAVVVVHHTRKAEAEDPLDLISGSTGLTGAADGAWILTRQRGSADAVLKVVHRDVPEAEHALRWDGPTRQWLRTGDASDTAPTRSPERQQIIELLTASAAPMGPKEIAERLGRNYNTIRVLLTRMARDGDLTTDAGRYALAGQDGPRQERLAGDFGDDRRTTATHHLQRGATHATGATAATAATQELTQRAVDNRELHQSCTPLAGYEDDFPSPDAVVDRQSCSVAPVAPVEPLPTATPDADPPPICWACGEALASDAERARSMCDHCAYER